MLSFTKQDYFVKISAGHENLAYFHENFHFHESFCKKRKFSQMFEKIWGEDLVNIFVTLFGGNGNI
jgi:hypothetical protein